MADPDEHLRAGFRRARTFLIGASLALAFTHLLGIEFKQVSVLGNSADIPHPEQVGWIIWIVWAWAFAQYVVWFRDVGAWSEFRSAVTEVCGKYFGEVASNAPTPPWLIRDLNQKLAMQIQGLEDPDIKYQSEFADIEVDRKRKLKVVNVQTRAYVTLPDNRGRAISGDIRWETEVSDEVWQRYDRRATVRVLLTSRFALEYFAPFFIGLLPIIAVVYVHYHPHPVEPPREVRTWPHLLP